MLYLRTLLLVALTLEAVVACAPSAAVYDAPSASRKKDSGAAPLPEEEVPPEGEFDAGELPIEADSGIDESTDAGVLPRDAGSIKGRLDGGGAQCRAVTLGRDVPQYTCVQAARNSMWYICDNAAWIEVSPNDPACIAKFPL